MILIPIFYYWHKAVWSVSLRGAWKIPLLFSEQAENPNLFLFLRDCFAPARLARIP